MKQEEDKFTGLPENAFRELKPGEVYNPLMSPSKNYPEVNFWSVTWGIAMAILFSAAAAYLGLKVGQVFEAAIPIAIIAVGVSGAAKRKNAVGENVRIQQVRQDHRQGELQNGAPACMFRCHRSRSHLHPSRPLYPSSQISRNDGQLYAGIYQFIAGWCIGYPVPDSFP